MYCIVSSGGFFYASGWERSHFMHSLHRVNAVVACYPSVSFTLCYWSLLSRENKTQYTEVKLRCPSSTSVKKCSSSTGTWTGPNNSDDPLDLSSSTMSNSSLDQHFVLVRMMLQPHHKPAQKCLRNTAKSPRCWPGLCRCWIRLESEEFGGQANILCSFLCFLGGWAVTLVWPFHFIPHITPLPSGSVFHFLPHRLLFLSVLSLPSLPSFSATSLCLLWQRFMH